MDNILAKALDLQSAWHYHLMQCDTCRLLGHSAIDQETFCMSGHKMFLQLTKFGWQ